MSRMVSREITVESALPLKDVVPRATTDKWLINAWRTFVALVELPFVYPKLYYQIRQAFKDGANAAHWR